MTPSVLERLENDLDQLPLGDQLLLMERLARRIRERARPALNVSESELAAMADDPDIRRELDRINAEFSVTENDGLDPSR